MRRFLIGSMLLTVALAGCGSSSPVATVTPAPPSTLTPARSVPTVPSAGVPTATSPRQSLDQQNNELTMAERQWDAKQIDYYEVIVSFATPFSITPVVMVTTMVQSGRVVQSATSCPTNRSSACPAHAPATIPDLFTLARSEIADPHCVTSITYHIQFAFPQLIKCDNPPQQFDYQHSTSVVSFALPTP